MNNFFKLLSTNYKPLLTSLFLALLLWVAVITDKDYSRKLVVPFKISRLAPGYVFLTPPPDEVILEVSGKGRALFGINFYNASIDLELTEINKSTLLNLQEYQQRFSIPRNLGIKIVEIIEPKSIPLKIDRKLEKEISVQVIAAIKPEPGYILSNTQLSQATVLVSGPQAIVNNIGTVFSDSISRKDMKYPFTQEVTLHNPNPEIIIIEPDKIEVNFEISQLVERTFYNIPIQLIGIPSELIANATPPNVTIRVKGSEVDVSAINPDQISAIFNYRTMYEAGKTLYNTTIDAPAEAEILSVSPETFRLQLQRRED